MLIAAQKAPAWIACCASRALCWPSKRASACKAGSGALPVSVIVRTWHVSVAGALRVLGQARGTEIRIVGSGALPARVVPI
jgi:hypothetical protein